MGSSFLNGLALIPRTSILLFMELLLVGDVRQACAQVTKPARENSNPETPGDTPANSPISFMNSSNPRNDVIGDPLPARALMRFGTHRFQHPDSVNTMIVSPDENYILSLDYGNLIKWEAATGKELWRKRWLGPRISGPAYGQRFICFAGKASSQFFTAGEGHNVLVWSAATGENKTIELKRGFQLADLFSRRGGGNTSLDVTEDRKAFLAGGESGLGLYSEDSEQKWFLANRPKAPVQIGGNRDRLDFGGDYATALFSPDGKVIAAH